MPGVFYSSVPLYFQEQLENTFTSAKIELCQILDDCELLPLSIAERFACSENGLVQFDCNKKNYDLMVVSISVLLTNLDKGDIFITLYIKKS